jgi:hypothetical protein
MNLQISCQQRLRLALLLCCLFASRSRGYRGGDHRLQYVNNRFHSRFAGSNELKGLHHKAVSALLPPFVAPSCVPSCKLRNEVDDVSETRQIEAAEGLRLIDDKRNGETILQRQVALT